MRKFRVKRRTMHKSKVYQPGEIIELEPAEAGRLAFLGCVDGPLKEPKRSRKKDDLTAD